MTYGVAGVLVALVAIFVATKLFGEIAARLRQPAVLGELIAGVLLGGSVLGIVDPDHPVIATLSEMGVIILLFSIGLETELDSLVRVGSTATTVAVAGVILPFGLGYLSAVALGLDRIPALVCGAALCATSVGISARVLSELGWLETSEGKVVLGAAVIDDVIGLAILAIVASVVTGAALSLASIGPSAVIVGSFVAGLLLYRVRQRHQIDRATRKVGYFLVPVFFASVGAAVDLRALVDVRSLVLGLAFIAVGVFGKVVAGFAPWWFRGRKLVVGVAMVPRGEVGLIFAQMGLAASAISAGEYGALMLMVVTTTFVTPPALARLSRGRATERIFSS